MGDSDEENFVTFGIPLDPLDEENLPRKKPVTIEDQYAYDAQGRRRFHGAFTGGFSAGYFNTVGTRDGWRPQQFKSSRSSKAESYAQRPEDFMDEEDTGEFGIAPQGIRATRDFMDHGQKSRKRERVTQNNDGPIPGVPVLKELLRPVRDTVGVTLLKKMGWKPGQGVGPRVTKKEKRKIKERNEKVKIYGCALPQSSARASQSDSDGSEEDDTDVMFAPDDYEPFRCNPKDNYFGLGYTGLDRRPVLSSHVNLFDVPAFNVQDKNKKLSIRGQAFGVGAFEADDEDIYHREDMSRYDFSLGPERKSKSRWSQDEKSSTSSDCLEGFVPASSQLERKKIFRPPELPKDFVAVHAVRVSRFYPPIERVPRTMKNGGQANLNANDRARILEEPQRNDKMSVAANIVTRSLNLHGRQQTEERQSSNTSHSKAAPSWMERLKSQSFIKGDVIGTPSSGALQKLEEFQDSAKTTDASRLTENDSADAEKGKEASKPFLADPDKQRRFEQYLEFLRNNEKHKLDTIQPLSMTEWDRDHERVEFEQAARLQDRSANDLSSKFASSNDPPCETATASTAEDQMKQAARMKMFGKLTREKREWKPTSIVCKRFNVPEPQIGCAMPGVERRAKKFSVFENLDWNETTRFSRSSEATSNPDPVPVVAEGLDETTTTMTTAMTSTTTTTIDRQSPVSEKMRHFESSYEKVFGKGIQQAPLAKDDRQDVEENPVDEATRAENSPTEKTAAKKDLFKAIFLSSSSDSEDSTSEPEDAVDEEVVKSVLIGKDPAELNVQRNKSPPRGIFANVDFDSLLGPAREKVQKPTSPAVGADESLQETRSSEPMTTTTTTTATMEEEESNVDVYGPALPAKLLGNNATTTTTTATSTTESDPPKPVFRSVVVPRLGGASAGKWVERDKPKKAKKEKKRHKHKHKERAKHKHKKKDKR